MDVLGDDLEATEDWFPKDTKMLLIASIQNMKGNTM